MCWDLLAALNRRQSNQQTRRATHYKLYAHLRIVLTHKKREERKMEQIDYNEINNGVDESRSVVCLCRDDFSLLESRE